MDETTRAALKIALDVAYKDRDRAEAVIGLLSEKLGLAEAASSIVLGPGEAPEVEGPREVGPVHVAEGEFYGMSQTQAAFTFLERAGRTRPQRTEQIVAAIQKGGVRIGGKNPPGDTIYKVLRRDGRFHRPAPGTWGLSVWYPNARKTEKIATPATTPEAEELSEPNDEDRGSEEIPDWLAEAPSG